jgi:multicomponent Na+:H+ antiporter subunit F
VEAYYLGLALFFFATMAAGFVRVVRGPKPADRMLGIQLFGTTSVALLLILAEAAEDEALRNVGLVFVLLSLLVLVAFVERTPPAQTDQERPPS